MPDSPAKSASLTLYLTLLYLQKKPSKAINQNKFQN